MKSEAESGFDAESDPDLLQAAAPAPQSTNMRECLNEDIRRRTYVVRIFPHTESCLRLVRALAVETQKTGWRQPDTST
jgi:transposase-like protein